MSERHVVLRVGRGDEYTPNGAPNDTLFFSLHGTGSDAESKIGERHLWSRVRSAREVGLNDLDLKPPQTALDLYRISVAAYCADLRVLRRRDGYDDWTRQIVLHVPVADLTLWSSQVQTLSRLLSFLSGDRWRIELREREVSAPKRPRRARNKGKKPVEQPGPFHAVCLFSGGLDSFVGGADALAEGRNLLLVSHVPEGLARWLSPAQLSLVAGLAEANRDRRIEHLRVTLNPPRPTEHAGKENTQRARSILFLGLGTLAAAAIGDSTPLIVPENGFISLNVPLTPGRIGSFSTRTTHPNTVSLYRRLLRGLAIRVPIELPYMFQTKGEMLGGAKDPEVVRRLASRSVSCASPNPRSSAREDHCGYCVPCIIRRAAMSAAGLDHASAYRLDIRKPGRDLTNKEATHLKGFRMAIHHQAGGISLVDLLSAGPVPLSEGSATAFRGVHDRGLDEVAAFLGAKV